MLYANIALVSIDIVALVFLFGLLLSNNSLSKKRKKSFTSATCFTIIVILAEIGTLLVSDGGTQFRLLNIIFNIIGFTLTPAIPLVLIAIYDPDILRKNRVMLFPFLVNVLTVALSPFYGLIFCVDAYNVYTRGGLFYVFVGVYIINIVLLVFTTLYTCQKSLYPIKWKVICLSLFTIMGTFIQLFFPLIYAMWHCVTIALLLFYILFSEFDGSFDPLTQLYNRSTFEKASSQLSSKNPFALIVMDINKLKSLMTHRVMIMGIKF